MYEKYIPYKAMLENLFGTSVWYELKVSDDIKIWKKWIQKSFRAHQVSIAASVEHYDPQWKTEMDQVLEDGKRFLKECKSVDDAIAVAASVFTNASFLQIGLLPKRAGKPGPFNLRASDWKLNSYRTAAYLQTQEQKSRLEEDTLK